MKSEQLQRGRWEIRAVAQTVGDWKMEAQRTFGGLRAHPALDEWFYAGIVGGGQVSPNTLRIIRLERNKDKKGAQMTSPAFPP